MIWKCPACGANLPAEEEICFCDGLYEDDGWDEDEFPEDFDCMDDDYPYVDDPLDEWED